MSLQTVKFYLLAPVILPFFLLGSMGVEIIFKYRALKSRKE